MLVLYTMSFEVFQIPWPFTMQGALLPLKVVTVSIKMHDAWIRQKKFQVGFMAFTVIWIVWPKPRFDTFMHHTHTPCGVELKSVLPYLFASKIVQQSQQYILFMCEPPLPFITLMMHMSSASPCVPYHKQHCFLLLHETMIQSTG